MDENGGSIIEINIHALYSCLDTYLKNTDKIISIFESMKNTLESSLNVFLNTNVCGKPG